VKKDTHGDSGHDNPPCYFSMNPLLIINYSNHSSQILKKLRDYRRINGIHPSQLLKKLGNIRGQTVLSLVNSIVLIQLNIY